MKKVAHWISHWVNVLRIDSGPTSVSTNYIRNHGRRLVSSEVNKEQKNSRGITCHFWCVVGFFFWAVSLWFFNQYTCCAQLTDELVSDGRHGACWNHPRGMSYGHRPFSRTTMLLKRFRIFYRCGVWIYCYCSLPSWVAFSWELNERTHGGVVFCCQETRLLKRRQWRCAW